MPPELLAGTGFDNHVPTRSSFMYRCHACLTNRDPAGAQFTDGLLWRLIASAALVADGEDRRLYAVLQI